MPYVTELDMTTADFRQHYTPDPHWLLETAFGRDLLKMRLRQVEPGLQVPEWKYAAHLDLKLDRMVDDLGLRETAKPSTVWETLKFMKLASRSMLALSRGEPLPVWSLDRFQRSEPLAEPVEITASA